MVHLIGEANTAEKFASAGTNRRVVALRNNRREGHVLLGREGGKEVVFMQGKPRLRASPQNPRDTPDLISS